MSQFKREKHLQEISGRISFMKTSWKRLVNCRLCGQRVVVVDHASKPEEMHWKKKGVNNTRAVKCWECEADVWYDVHIKGSYGKV